MKVVLLRSVYQVPSYESNLTLLAWFLPDFAYLRMLLIPEMVCTAGSVDHLKNKSHAMAQISHSVGNGASNVTLNSNTGILNTTAILL